MQSRRIRRNLRRRSHNHGYQVSVACHPEPGRAVAGGQRAHGVVANGGEGSASRPRRCAYAPSNHFPSRWARTVHPGRQMVLGDGHESERKVAPRFCGAGGGCKSVLQPLLDLYAFCDSTSGRLWRFAGSNAHGVRPVPRRVFLFSLGECHAEPSTCHSEERSDEESAFSSTAKQATLSLGGRDFQRRSTDLRFEWLEKISKGDRPWDFWNE